MLEPILKPDPVPVSEALSFELPGLSSESVLLFLSSLLLPSLVVSSVLPISDKPSSFFFESNTPSQKEGSVSLFLSPSTSFFGLENHPESSSIVSSGRTSSS